MKKILLSIFIAFITIVSGIIASIFTNILLYKILLTIRFYMKFVSVGLIISIVFLFCLTFTIVLERLYVSFISLKLRYFYPAYVIGLLLGVALMAWVTAETSTGPNVGLAVAEVIAVTSVLWIAILGYIGLFSLIYYIISKKNQKKLADEKNKFKFGNVQLYEILISVPLLLIFILLVG